MKTVIAIDSFKGSLSSVMAGRAASDGIRRVFSDGEFIVRPIADGGEGTVEALTEGLGGTLRTVRVMGPLGTATQAQYGIVDGKTAVMEMSAAAGITLISEKERNPLYTTTYGVGEMIADAVSLGCRNFIIGIGGSATNDGGIGMLRALGFEILDSKGQEVPHGAKGLKDICEINGNNIIDGLKDCTFNIACDVTNPLCGDNGCSAVYGPQKGADSAMIADMDSWLCRYAEIAGKTFPNADKNARGAGAAGGLGFAFLTFLSGKLVNGIDLILKETKLEDYIKDADLVVTGEGRLDSQTAMGKAPAGVASIARKYSVPVIAFSGCVTKEAGIVNEHGIDAFFPVLRTVCTLEEAMNTENAYSNMADTAEQAARLIKVFSK